MRIRKVTLEGFGPFKDAQVVDFAEFDANGLFLIGGETGAGKSSILDGIAYALYGSTPRWEDSSATGVGNRVRSDYCGVDDPTRVVLELEANGGEYRVTRSPAYERPKGRGTGTTTQAATVVVEKFEHGQWLGLAAKEREAAETIARLVKLTAQEFLQVILLAQGRFQAFLLADSTERLGLLSKLFDTKRFHDYQDRILGRRSELAKKAEASRSERAALLANVSVPDSLDGPELGGELKWIEQVAGVAAERVVHAQKRLDATEADEKAAGEVVQIATRQRQVADARAQLAQLEAARPEIEAASATLTSAERAERVRALIDGAQAARMKRDVAQAALDDARARYKSGVPDQALGAEVTRLDGELAKLVDALLDEDRTTALQREHDAKLVEIEQLSTRLTELLTNVEQFQAERVVLGAPAVQHQSRQETVSRIAERLTAAQSAQDARRRLTAAQEQQLSADQKFGAAHQAATDTLARFLRGQAASLAATLVDGEPCVVCGSPDHPAPATSDVSAVTQDDLEAAQSAAEKLETTAKAAKAAVDAISTELAGLTGAAGAGDVDSIIIELEAAEAQLAEAVAAATRLEAIDALLNEEDGVLAAKAAVERVLSEAKAEAASLVTERDTLQKRLQTLRGDFETVKARQKHLAADRRGASELADALETVASAIATLADAEKRCEAKAKQEGFEQSSRAADALLDEQAVTALRARVDEHRAAISESQGVLKQPDLQALPTEQIELSAAKESLESAKGAAKAAVAELADAKSGESAVRRQRTELAKLLKASAALDSQFEVLNRLTETIHGRTPNMKGMSLETYYVAAELEEVLAAANVRLTAMSNGRYALQHSERGTRRANVAAGLELEVMDEYTGKARDPHTLSGGEQFLTSLALALGLAEVVTGRAGGVELETLFVDEGFGSLSPEYLDIAMATLDSLKQGGRTVGVISHVESMKESIASQVVVVRTPGGGSQVKQETVGH